MVSERHYCPSCRSGLAAKPIGAPLRCKHCDWHLVSLSEWQTLPPFQQGFVMYMQAAWPTSELASVKNPYPEKSPKWEKFNQGEQQAYLNVLDGEE